MIKFTKTLVESLLNNDYKELNYIGFIAVERGDLEEITWCMKCHEAALEKLLASTYADMNALYIDGLLHLKSDALRSVTSFRSRNIMCGDKINGYVIFSNTGKILFKYTDEEIELDWDMRQGSILLDFCDRSIASDFFLAKSEALTAWDFMQCSNLIKRKIFSSTDDFLRAKLEIAIEQRVYAWGEIEYNNYDDLISIINSQSNYLELIVAGNNLLLIEHEGNVGIVDIGRDYIKYIQQGETFSWDGVNGVAEAGVLSKIQTEMVDLGVKVRSNLTPSPTKKKSKIKP